MSVVRSASRCCLGFGVLLASIAAARVAVGVDLVDVVKKFEPAVVQIETNEALGSGVIVDDRGFVLTNYHVIEGAKTAKVKLRSGESVEVRGFMAADSSRDLAILKIDKLSESRAAKLAAELPQTGEKVAAFGNPRGLSFTTSEGIVSAIRTGEEVRELIGPDNYRALGYGVDDTWIQTTAQISSGNSGGPLVNMKGQIVGLNTWSVTEGQNLNFAIGMPDIKWLMNKPDSTRLKELEKLPKPRVRSRGSRLESFSLTFPTGRVFSFRVFETDPTVLLPRSERDTKNAVLIRHENGSLSGIATQKEGVLEGLMMISYENKQPMLVATYLGGKRHGVVKTFNEKGQPVLLAQYVKGKRHGLSCLFDEGRLRLLAEHKYDEAKWLQLMSHFSALEGFPSRSEAEKNSEAREALAKLDQAESVLKTNELACRKKVQASEQERRRALAGQIGSQKRAQAETRATQQAAEDEASLQQMYRKAYGH